MCRPKPAVAEPVLEVYFTCIVVFTVLAGAARVVFNASASSYANAIHVPCNLDLSNSEMEVVILIYSQWDAFGTFAIKNNALVTVMEPVESGMARSSLISSA